MKSSDYPTTTELATNPQLLETNNPQLLEGEEAKQQQLEDVDVDKEVKPHRSERPLGTGAGAKLSSLLAAEKDKGLDEVRDDIPETALEKDGK